MLSDKKNSLWLTLQYILSLVISLVTLKLNISHFGTELFAIWLLLTSVWGLSSIFDFGFGTSVLKYVAEYKDDKIKVNQIISSSFFVYIIIGVLIYIAGNLAAYFIYINNTGIISDNSKNSFLTVSLLLGLSFTLQYFGLFFKSIIDGLSNFSFTSKVIILRSIIDFVGVAVISYFDFKILYLAVLYIIETSTILIIYLGFFIYKVKDYRISIKHFNKNEIKKIVSFSLSVQLMSVFNALIDPAIKYIIGNYYDIGTVSIYEIARRFAVAVSGLFFNAFKIILPKASSLKSEKEKVNFLKTEIVKFSSLGIIYSGVIFGILFLPLIFVIINIFNYPEVVIIFLILALPESINNFGYSIYNYLLGIGKVKLLVFIQMNNLIFVAVCMSIGFIMFQNIFGLLGYFISVVIANILMLVYIHRKWKVYDWNFFIRCKIHKLLALIVLMIACIFSLYFNILPLYYNFGLLSAISTLIFSNDLKDIYMQMIKPILINKTIF